MQVGGFYVTTIPIWIAWLKYLSFVYYGYNLLLKIEYAGLTLWDCAGTSPPDPAHNPLCTLVPPGGLQAKLHLQAGPPISLFSVPLPCSAAMSNE
jgi:hypothetical protein